MSTGIGSKTHQSTRKLMFNVSCSLLYKMLIGQLALNATSVGFMWCSVLGPMFCGVPFLINFWVKNNAFWAWIPAKFRWNTTGAQPEICQERG